MLRQAVGGESNISFGLSSGGGRSGRTAPTLHPARPTGATLSPRVQVFGRREEAARRRREREVLHYKKEADSIIDALDETERQSGQLQPESATTDYEQQEEERLLQRDDTLENQAEFDRFMRELETAEERNNDPR